VDAIPRSNPSLMLTLYYAAPSRAFRPRWLLEEIGEPYELVRLDLSAGEQKRPEYLAINPNGTVPTLIDGDLTLFESAAICQHLADRFPDAGLAPSVGTRERGLYYQWMHYAMTSLDAPVIALFHHTTFLPEAERVPALAEESRRTFSAALSVVDQALADRPFLLGERFTAADIMVGSTLIWGQGLRLIPPERAAALAYAGRLARRPAFVRATAD
jgi:glutathione S-transferase